MEIFSATDSRLDSITYSSPWAALNVTVGYDSFNRQTALSNAAASYTYTLDDLSDVLTKTTTIAGGPANQQFVYDYYPDGSRKSITLPGSGQVNNALTGTRASSLTPTTARPASRSPHSHGLPGRTAPRPAPRKRSLTAIGPTAG
jgi:hypothetical protein